MAVVFQVRMQRTLKDREVSTNSEGLPERDGGGGSLECRMREQVGGMVFRVYVSGLEVEGPGCRLKWWGLKFRI